MRRQFLRTKAGVIHWKRFSRKGYAIFCSLGREIVISILSVATLTFAVPATSKAQMSMAISSDVEETESDTLPELEVTASRLALPMEQAARIVSVITREEIQLCPAQSVNDILKLCSGVDVRQRGAFGIQTDISIDGGTHDQIVILLNGVNISSPHTGHLAADFPVSKDDIERIEILEGAASRVYGTSAFSGAVNIITRKNTNTTFKKKTHGSAEVQGGSFGTFGANASLDLNGKNSFNHLSSGYKRSDGGTRNSGFEKSNLFYNGGVTIDKTDINWQFGASNQSYGANTFYSGRYPDQYEHNTRYMGAVSLKTHGRVSLSPTVYYTRSTDHYQLIRHSDTGENYHLTDVYGATVNATTKWLCGTTVGGVDIRNEGILSTALGRPLDENNYVKIHGTDGYYTKKDNHTNITYFLEHDIVLDKFTFSAGLMANMNSALDHRIRLYPGVDVSYRPNSNLRLLASWNMAQRMPTFTELYYKSPTQEGNTGLRPEKTSEFSISAVYRTRGFKADIRLFHRHQKSMIDWIMTPADSVNGYTTFHAANFKVNNMGVGINSTLLFRELFGADSYLNTFNVSYTYLHQRRHDETEVFASSYALDYLRHKLVAVLSAKVVDHLTAEVSFRYQKRLGSFVKYTSGTDESGNLQYTASSVDYSPYGLLGMKLLWTDSRYELSVEAENLTGRRYYDIGNVRQPGLWLMAGAKIKF